MDVVDRLLQGDPAIRWQVLRDRVRWDQESEPPYFAGQTEPCVNGTALASAVYFGEDGGRGSAKGELLGAGGRSTCWSAACSGD